ncbi:Acid protease [Yarrowia sp. C11]|nr:Acid protease [Yarrowia sp. C11]KAG5370536.1 Acid protease [Yarrowia sp. E02]
MKSLLLPLLAVPATAQLLLDLQGHDTTDPRLQPQNNNRLSRRKTVEQDLVQKFAYYEATVSVGSPGQQIKLLLDTGSSDMWVLGQDVDCGGGFLSQGVDCTISGVFDTSKSSTYQKNESMPFDVKYSDGSESKGSYGTDNLGLGGTTLKDFTFAVADTASDGQAVLGIGPIENEQSLYTDNPIAYANLPMALMMEGVTKSSAFSLWLNDKDELKGSILFGGYDRAKVDGKLFTVPIVNLNPGGKGRSREYNVGLDSITVGGKSVGSSTPALLDSGTTLCNLPQDMVDAILGQFSDVSNSLRTGYYTKCSNVPQGSIDFVFSGNKLTVELADLMKPLENPDGSKITTDGEQACGILVTANTDSHSISDSVVLGASFLRSAYVVYDRDAQKIMMGKAKYGVSSSDIVELEEGSGQGVASAESSAESQATASASGESSGESQATTSEESGQEVSTMAVVVRPSDTAESAYITNIIVTPSATPALSTATVVVRPSDTNLPAYITEVVVTPTALPWTTVVSTTAIESTEVVTVTSCSEGKCEHEKSTVYKIVDATVTQTIWSCDGDESATWAPAPTLETQVKNTPAYQAPSAPPVFLPAWGTQSDGETATHTETSFFNPQTYTGPPAKPTGGNTGGEGGSTGITQASGASALTPMTSLLVLLLSFLIWA